LLQEVPAAHIGTAIRHRRLVKGAAMRRVITAVALTVLAFSVSVHAQNAGSQLLPDSFTRSIGIKWEQDGRVVNIDLGNPKGDFVLLD
jgi:hypothetical protein